MLIKKVHIHNFKCYRDFCAEFASGVNTISGRNASGKTSIADAIAWCFFNTDYLGNNNPPVRKEGTGDDEDVSVSIETDTDTYAKSQTRTRKGNSYSDSNAFSINGIKTGKTEFEASFAKYKYAMLPGAFLKLRPDAMRQELFKCFCPVNAATTAKALKFKELLRELESGKSLEAISADNRVISSAAAKEIAATALKIEGLEEAIKTREDIPYSDLELEKAELKRMATAASSPCPACGAETSPEVARYLERITEIDRKFAMRDTSTEESRIEALRAIRKELVQKHADAERLVYQTEKLKHTLSKSYIDEINMPFQKVEWEFTEVNKSGIEKNACIPTIGGRSLLDGSANKAARLAGKIDICLAFGKGNAPVIIDDAESLDRDTLTGILEELTCQVILLKVTNEKKLNIKKGI